jgi:hypothetical protein
MCVTAGGTSCDPTRLTFRSRQSTIEGHPALCDDKRAPGDNPLVERLVNLRAIIGQNAFSYADARISQLHNALAGVTRIYVSRTDNNVSNTSFEYCICAWSSASLCGARFECDVERRTLGHGRCKTAEAFNLSVIAAGSSMMAFRHDPIADNENRADRGIRAGLA